ncbi:MAG TPA: hypothetical protein PKW05_13780, partial [Anaerolineae bacterium]|nr:hypothetical protein [Anaerolineae bacterium]
MPLREDLQDFPGLSHTAFQHPLDKQAMAALEKVPLLAKAYNARLIALTMGASGIPVAADERVNIAVEQLIPRM